MKWAGEDFEEAESQRERKFEKTAQSITSEALKKWLKVNFSFVRKTKTIITKKQRHENVRQ